uniref:Aspartyl/asparaginy/proline hydroxylase domain-containing protein n=1 Tax=Strigamia maritima TaxID=126957 RepID=T1JK47_STRMM
MSGEVQHRKRKDKRKRKSEFQLFLIGSAARSWPKWPKNAAKIDEGPSRHDDVIDHSENDNNKNEDEHLLRDNSEDKNQDVHDHHHGPTAGFGAKITFFILFAGLLVAMGAIFFQMRGTEIRDIPIKESRYARLLENFIEEFSGDEHEEHDLPHVAEHEETDEHEADREEGILPDTYEPPSEPDTKPIPDVLLEPSMPETIEIPQPVAADEDEIEEPEEVEDEIEIIDEIKDPVSTVVEINEEEILLDEIPASDEILQDVLVSEEIEQLESLETEKIEYQEEHPTEEMPQLAEQEMTPITVNEDNQSPEDHVESSESQSPESTEERQEMKKGYFHTLLEGMYFQVYSQEEKTEDIQSHKEESDKDNINENPFMKSHYADFDYGEESKEESKESSAEDDEIDEIDEGGNLLKETRKEYIKIIDDVLREQQQQQQQQQQRHQNQQKADDRSSYAQSAITNDYDFEIRKEIDEADKLVEKAPDRALTMFQSILELHPQSPRAVFGKAMAIGGLSDVHKSNQMLEQCIFTFKDVLDLPDVPDDLFRMAALKCTDRMRFRGFHIKSLKVLDRLIHRFPGDVSVVNQKAVTYLLMGRNKDAKEVLEEALKLNPVDGFAKCHYGFILKIEEHNNKLAIKYLSEGLSTQEPGTMDGRFYFHLGDALMRENRSDEAYKVYEQGTDKGLFLSIYQRSLYNVRNLKAIPWWTHEQTTYQPYLKMLEKYWKKIRDEAVLLIGDENQGFFPENEGLRNKGTWKQFEMFARGRKITQNCERTPFTCQLIEGIPEAKDCKRGQVKFSLLMPGTKVWPHTGPTNCRLRTHLGLVVPDGAGIRVANETRTWKEGKVMIFDDSFEHEVWHEGTSFRLILIVDFWHPELTEAQKQTLTPI